MASLTSTSNLGSISINTNDSTSNSRRSSAVTTSASDGGDNWSGLVSRRTRASEAARLATASGIGNPLRRLRNALVPATSLSKQAQAEQARLFLQAIRVADGPERAFGGKLVVERLDKGASLRNYYRALDVARAFAARPRLLPAVQEFLPSLSLPTDLAPLAETVVGHKASHQSRSAKTTPGLQRARLAALTSEPCGALALSGSQLQARVAARDATALALSDAGLELLCLKYGGVARLAEVDGAGDAAWTVALLRAWERSLALGLEHTEDAVVEFVSKRWSVLRAAPGGAQDAIARLYLRASVDVRPSAAISKLDGMAQFLPAYHQHERRSLGVLAPFRKRQAGKKRLREAESSRSDPTQTLRKLHGAVTPNESTRARGLVELLSSFASQDPAALVNAAVEAFAKAELTRIDVAALPAHQLVELADAMVDCGHLGLVAVWAGLFTSAPNPALRAALTAQGFSLSQIDAALGYAQALCELPARRLQATLSDVFVGTAVDFSHFPLALKLAGIATLSSTDVSAALDANEQDPEGALRAICIRADAGNDAERDAVAKVLRDLVITGNLEAATVLTHASYRRILPALGRSLDTAVTAVQKANVDQAAISSLADFIEQHSDIVAAKELAFDALEQFYAADLLRVAPLAVVDEALGGVSPRRWTGTTDMGPTIEVAGTLLPKNVDPDKDTRVVPSLETSDLIMTPTTVLNLKRIAALVATGKPVLLEGPTSAGKTSAVRYLAMRTGAPLRRLNLSYHTTVFDLVGRYVGGENRYTSDDLAAMTDQEIAKLAKEYELDERQPRAEQVAALLVVQNNPRWVDGAVVRAARNGEWLVLDEVNLARAEVLERLNSLFDGDGNIMLTERGGGAKVVAARGFRIFATMNPASYAGRARLSVAMRSRWISVHCSALTQTDLLAVLVAKYERKVPNTELVKLVAFHMRASEEADNGKLGRAIGGMAFSLRNMERVCERFVRYRTRGLAPDALMRRETEEVYSGSLVTTEDLKLVDDLLKSAMPCANTSFYGRLALSETATTLTIGDVTLSKVNSSHDFVPGRASRLVLTQRTREVLYRIAKCIDCDENVLLIGERASGKTAMVAMMAHLLGQPYYRQIISAATDSMQLVGGYDDRGWHDGLMLQAARVQNDPGVLLLDELNMGNSALLERLNPLLERNRKMVLAEREGEEVDVNPRFRLLGAMNPPTLDYAGRNKLSLALHNRMTGIYVESLGEEAELREIAGVRAQEIGVDETVAAFLVSMHQWVKNAYTSSILGSKIPLQDRPVLSYRQLLSALEMIGWFAGEKGDVDAFLLACEVHYASTASVSDNEAVMKRAREVAR